MGNWGILIQFSADLGLPWPGALLDYANFPSFIGPQTRNSACGYLLMVLGLRHHVRITMAFPSVPVALLWLYTRLCTCLPFSFGGLLGSGQAGTLKNLAFLRYPACTAASLQVFSLQRWRACGVCAQITHCSFLRPLVPLRDHQCTL